MSGEVARAQEMHIIERRRKVAALRLRGMTIQEITRALPLEPGPIVNPETHRPYSINTVGSDLQKLKREWKEHAVEDLWEHKARHLAELAEVRRASWQQNKLFYVLKSLEQEAAILGLNDMPELPGVNVNIANFDLSGVPTDELRRIAEVLDIAAGTPRSLGGETGIIEAG